MLNLSKWQGVFVIGALACSISAQEEGKITDGVEVSIKDYPYQISFRYNDQHFCGGSIYNEFWIVTAAHCVADFKGNVDGLTIVAGQSKLSDTDGQSIPVSKLIPHPKYNPENVDYDVALLQLAQPLTLNESVQPLPLTTSRVKPHTEAVVSGWGTTHRGGGGEVSDQLLAAQLQVEFRFLCQIQYRFQLTRRMFCAAGSIFGGRDSCQGDSGGPVKANDVLVGIVSFGRGCGNSFSPGVYTDVDAVHDFIVSNAN